MLDKPYYLNSINRLLLFVFFCVGCHTELVLTEGLGTFDIFELHVAGLNDMTTLGLHKGLILRLFFTAWLCSGIRLVNLHW